MAYKRTVVMVRALHAAVQVVTGEQVPQGGEAFAVPRTSLRDVARGSDGGDGREVDSSDVTAVTAVEEEKPSGDFGEYSFTPVRTPAGGSLRAVVYFLDADKLAGMDCVPKPTAPRVIDGYLGGGQKRSETAGGGGLTRRAGAPSSFEPHERVALPFSPTDARLPPRHDFGFGTSPSSGGVSGRPFRANSWAGKATYGFGASPPARATLPAGGSPVTTGDGVPGRLTPRRIPRDALRGHRGAEGERGGRGRGKRSFGRSFGRSGDEGGSRLVARPRSRRRRRLRFTALASGRSGRLQTSETKFPQVPPGTEASGPRTAGSPSLPFASTSHPTRFTPLGSGGSGPRGGGHGFSTSLASGDHALARRAREFGRSPGDGQTLPGSRPQSARLNGGAIDDSPPWHFRGFTGALSASPGSTPGGGTTPRGSHGSHGGGSAGGAGHHQSNSGGGTDPTPSGCVTRLGEAPASPVVVVALVVAERVAEPRRGRERRRGRGWGDRLARRRSALGAAGVVAGAARIAYSHGGVGGFNGAPHAYSYGASPGASPGGSFANAMAHLRAQRAGQGAGAGVAATGFNGSRTRDTARCSRAARTATNCRSRSTTKTMA